MSWTCLFAMQNASVTAVTDVVQGLGFWVCFEVHTSDTRSSEEAGPLSPLPSPLSPLPSPLSPLPSPLSLLPSPSPSPFPSPSRLLLQCLLQLWRALWAEMRWVCEALGLGQALNSNGGRPVSQLVHQPEVPPCWAGQQFPRNRHVQVESPGESRLSRRPSLG